MALLRRQQLSPDQRNAHSTAIINNLNQHLNHDLPEVDTLLLYHAMPSEVDTQHLLEHSSYQKFAPVMQHHNQMQWLRVHSDSAWKKGAFGALEPERGEPWNPLKHTSVLLCPLTAFDRQGNRLGMGKGCFDRWLADNRQHLRKIIGLAFSCQEFPHLPTEPHDVPMHCVITQKEVISCQMR